MTVEKIVEAVYLRVTGGSPSPDNSIMRADIRVYVPDGVNALMVRYYAAEQQSEPTGQPNPLFLQVFDNVSASLDSVRKKYKMELPKRALSIPVAKSVRSIGLTSGLLFEHFYPENGTLESYRIQTDRSIPAFSVEGNEVVFYNFPGDGTTPLVVKQLVHIDDYEDDTDEILVPSGAESELIDIIYNMVSAQRSNPDNRIIDGKEDMQ